MTYDQFWNDDVELARFYREAWQLKQQQENQRLWLQGVYVYEAILDAAPILHAFAKRGTKPVPYRNQPYELFAEKKTEHITKEQKSDNKAKAMMEMFMVNFNKRFEKKGGEENGS